MISSYVMTGMLLVRVQTYAWTHNMVYRGRRRHAAQKRRSYKTYAHAIALRDDWHAAGARANIMDTQHGLPRQKAPSSPDKALTQNMRACSGKAF